MMRREKKKDVNDSNVFKDVSENVEVEKSKEKGRKEFAKGVFSETSPSEKKCPHKRFRQVLKTWKGADLHILVVCRSCRKAAEEVYSKSQNSSSVFASKRFLWL